jgi:hypothetical protein
MKIHLDPELVEYLNQVTGEPHLLFSEIKEEDKITEESLHKLIIYVEYMTWKGAQTYLVRVRNGRGSWYVAEAEDYEYRDFVVMTTASELSFLIIEQFCSDEINPEDISYIPSIEPYHYDIPNQNNILGFLNQLFGLVGNEEHSLNMEKVFQDKQKEKIAESEMISEDEFKRMWGG